MFDLSFAAGQFWPSHRSGWRPKGAFPRVLAVTAQSTILCVDDDPALRALNARLLSKAGYKVLLAGNAMAAIEYSRSTPDLALVLMDVHMPGGTGFEALQIIKADPGLRDIPVLMVSATLDVEKNRDAAKKLGAVDLLAYPLSDEALLRHVRLAIGRRKGSPAME